MRRCTFECGCIQQAIATGSLYGQNCRMGVCFDGHDPSLGNIVYLMKCPDYFSGYITTVRTLLPLKQSGHYKVSGQFLRQYDNCPDTTVLKKMKSVEKI